MKTKNKTPAPQSNGLALGQQLKVKDVEVVVRHLNAGIAFCSPIKDERDWHLFVGLAVFKIYPDGSIKELYPWGGA